MSPNPYAVLGLKENATQADIHRAFRKLAKKFHPDVNHGDKTAEEKFKTLTAAYDQLTGKTPAPQEVAPPPRYDYKYLSELEERVRAQRAQTKKPERMFGNISSFFKSRFGS